MLCLMHIFSLHKNNDNSKEDRENAQNIMYVNISGILKMTSKFACKEGPKEFEFSESVHLNI